MIPPFLADLLEKLLASHDSPWVFPGLKGTLFMKFISGKSFMPFVYDRVLLGIVLVPRLCAPNRPRITSDLNVVRNMTNWPFAQVGHMVALGGSAKGQHESPGQPRGS
ncbi:hypothetical protein ACFWY6_21295 [Streptomyces sp. NPDC059037]|uniref:hypothetical protein n=1 Tax=Streptomyces sp. NPDC059037 TaxID=3346710 RepID=UPI0036C4BFAD